jgi:hypothetical protein
METIIPDGSRFELIARPVALRPDLLWSGPSQLIEQKRTTRQIGAKWRAPTEKEDGGSEECQWPTVEGRAAMLNV